MDKKSSWQDNESWSSEDAKIQAEIDAKKKKERNEHNGKLSLWNSDGTGLFNKLFGWFKKKD